MTQITLPKRRRVRPVTNKSMPHAQIGVDPSPEILKTLFHRCYSLPNVKNRPTVMSVPGARALWLAEGVELAHPEAIVRGREFAHIHPDGSLHVALPPERAAEAITTGWAELHPLAQMMANVGMVLLYTPQDQDELEVIVRLVVDSYNFVTGRREQVSVGARKVNS